MRAIFGNKTIAVTFNTPIDTSSDEALLLTDCGLPNLFGGELAIATFLGSAKPPGKH